MLALFSCAREWCLVLTASLAFALGWNRTVQEGWWPSPIPAPTSLAVRKVFPIINPHPFGYTLSPFPFDLASTGREQIAPSSPVALWGDHYQEPKTLPASSDLGALSSSNVLQRCWEGPWPHEAKAAWPSLTFSCHLLHERWGAEQRQVRERAVGGLCDPSSAFLLQGVCRRQLCKTFTQMWHRTLPKRDLKWDTLEQECWEGGEGVSGGSTGGTEPCHARTDCWAQPGFGAASPSPPLHQPGHGHLSSGKALGRQWWEKVLGPHNTNEIILITLGNGPCMQNQVGFCLQGIGRSHDTASSGTEGGR